LFLALYGVGFIFQGIGPQFLSSEGTTQSR
jgi:hypothetical protein